MDPNGYAWAFLARFHGKLWRRCYCPAMSLNHFSRGLTNLERRPMGSNFDDKFSASRSPSFVTRRLLNFFP